MRTSSRIVNAIVVSAVLAVGLYLTLRGQDRDQSSKGISRISSEIPKFANLQGLAKVEAIRNWVFANTDVAAGDRFLLAYQQYPLHTFTTENLLALHAEDVGGLYCAGINYTLKRVYDAFGYKSWMYSYGDPQSVTHAVALVEVEGNLYIQDAYFNVSYFDRHDRPLPFYEMLEDLLNGTEPAVRAGDARWRDAHLPHSANASWVAAGVLPDSCKSHSGDWRVCKSKTSLDNFISRYDHIESAYTFLARSGFPKSLHYLSFFPIGINRDGWIDDPAESEILRRVIAIRDRSVPMTGKRGA